MLTVCGASDFVSIETPAFCGSSGIVIVGFIVGIAASWVSICRMASRWLARRALSAAPSWAAISLPSARTASRMLFFSWFSFISCAALLLVDAPVNTRVKKAWGSNSG